jgi:hypothetical protein
MKPMGLLLLALFIGGCDAVPSGATMGPTGHRTDSQNLTPVKVLATWKADLVPQTQDVIKQRVRFPDTARFDGKVGYEAYYDRIRDVTWMAISGNVTCTGDVGQVVQNGYYVVWEQHGRNVADFPPPWNLASADLLDQMF